MPTKVSVIVPTHNRPHFLGRTIDSLLAQTYRHTEVVVVDDNSPDSPARADTQALMKKYENNANVIYIQNERSLGGGPARNAGIAVASGDYVTFLDDDDVYLPEKIDTQLSFMLANDLDMSFTDVFLHSADGKLVEYRRHSYVDDCSNEALFRQHILHSLCPTSTFMIKRSFILSTDGFRSVPMGQDFMLMWDMLEHGAKTGYLPVSYIIQYLHNEGRISVGKNKINGEKSLYNLKKTKFDLLSSKERRYVRFRHYAVLSVASFRSGNPLGAIGYGIRTAITSPSDLIKESTQFIRNRRIARNSVSGNK
ncbi:MAG: glycosyltransferase family 2 protein [Clostridia bacterium]|nr:glycosyltransferase family 2 protein [Clostridia bacterium]